MKKKIISFFIIIVLMILGITEESNALLLDDHFSNTLPATTNRLQEPQRQDTQSSGTINTDYYKPDSTTTSSTERYGNLGLKIVSALNLVGSAISALVIIVLGIKYMMGSVEERASYKKTMLPYVIGAIMVFGIVNILEIVVNIVSESF